MNYKDKIKLILIFNFIIASCFGQEELFNPDRPANISSPSVDVASLMKFVDVPISYFNGTPQVSFPLYTLNSNKVNVEINLTYNASGIKVEDDATIVGLGWTLSAGGSIARAIVGKPDETNDGYRHSAGLYSLPSYDTPLAESWLEDLSSCSKLKLSEGKVDLLPDVYYLNFNGHSAKMYIDKSGNPLLSPYKAWKIQGNENVGFKVIIEDGTIYEFNNIENSKVDISSNVESEGSLTQGNTAWFLTKIISSNLSDTIKFNYVSISYEMGGKNISETFSDLNTGQIPPSCAGTPVFTTRTQYFSNQYISTYLLSSIEGRLERIDFMYQKGRLDTDATFGGLDYKLNQIEVHKKTGGELIRRYKFDYNYFGHANGNPIDKRLMLKGYKQIGGIDSLTYGFSYFDAEQMPPRNSKAQDHWGYYNGANNSTLVPRYTDGNQLEFSGADREPRVNIATIGALSQIRYPTGGTVDFTYESNDYSFVKGSYINNNGQLDSILVDTVVSVSTVNLSTPSGSVSKTFYLPPSSEPATITCLVRGKIFGDALAEVYVKEGNSTLLVSGDTHGHSYNLGFIYPGNGRLLTLIASRDLPSELATITARYRKSQSVIKPSILSKLAGGIRIKRIVEKGNPDSSKNIIKEFKYTLNDTLSSGVIMNLPIYQDYSYSPVYCQVGNSGPPVKVGDLLYLNRHSVAMNALSRNQGGVVGYSKVTVLLGENGENGREEYFFSNTPFDKGGSGFPQIPYTGYDDLRGLLLKKITYGSNGLVLKSIENSYKLNDKPGDTNLKWIFGAKFGIRKRDNTNGGIGACPDTWDFLGGMYKQFQFWPVLSSIKESTIDMNSGTYINNFTKIEYNPTNLLVSREVRFKSNGDSIIHIIKYPIDYSTPAHTALASKNIIDKPIEELLYNNNSQIRRQKINYDFQSENLIIPKDVEIQLGNNQIEKRYYFFNYDKHENILEQAKAFEPHSSYIWGYSGRYLMAEIKGASYLTAISFINQSLLENTENYSQQQIINEFNKIRIGLANAGALVTTYTYDPLVGMTSMTDARGMTTYYEYDDFQRLKNIRDHDRNIIRNICYNYKGEETGCPVSEVPIYSNVPKSGSFSRDNCTPGNISGPAVTYTVAAGTYSALSQAKADSLAQVDVNTNGQAYANTNGTCVTAPPVAVYGSNLWNVGGTVTFYNVNTLQSYSIGIAANLNYVSIGSIPAGKYNVTISMSNFNPYVFIFNGVSHSNTGSVTTYSGVTLSGRCDVSISN